jgi:hypothetical protein
MGEAKDGKLLAAASAIAVVQFAKLRMRGILLCCLTFELSGLPQIGAEGRE